MEKRIMDKSAVGFVSLALFVLVIGLAGGDIAMGKFPDEATCPNPADEANDIAVNADLSWAPGHGAATHKVYFGTDETDVTNGTGDTYKGEQSQTTYDPCIMSPNTVYYWKIDEVNEPNTTAGDVWSFTTVTAKAGGASPANGQPNASPNAVLHWTAGYGTTAHNVYFGTDETEVTNGTGGTYKGQQSQTVYDPCILDAGTVYYWRIDEVNEPNTTTGDVWNFTVRDYIEGDLSGDNFVDWTDLLSFTEKWLFNCLVDDCGGADFDSSNDVDFIDFAYLGQNWSTGLKISLDQELSDLIIEPNDSQYISFIVDLMTSETEMYNVKFEQSISDNNGVTLESDYTGGWSTPNDMSWPVNECITGLSPGSYVLTTTATIVETGDTATSHITIDVVEAVVEVPVLWQPGVEPDGIGPNTPTNVTFTVLLTGLSSPPSSVQLYQVGNPISICDLFDDGNDVANGDMDANDCVYSGIYQIPASAVGKLYFRTGLTYGDYNDISEECTLMVTDFPIGPHDSDPNQFVFDPNNLKIDPNQILVSFYEGVSEASIQSIVDTIPVANDVIGTIPSLGLYQIGIIGDGTPNGVYAAITAFEAFTDDVNFAEENFFVEEDAVFVPNDPQFPNQNNMKVVRADEAWIVAKGTIIIGVVDTGVDYNHQDLNSKVIKGWDFIGWDNDPMDQSSVSHGTHVAGIAAAESNNNTGVTGASWYSEILAVRGIPGRVSQLAAAIKYASNRGCKVINVSGGTNASTLSLRLAVDYVYRRGGLLCATAGNSGTNTRRYPGAYSKAFCVANTTDNDRRASSSRFGSWVDISAPGVNVLSTIRNNGYGRLTGTSMSCPLVSGSAAVVWSMNPSWNAGQVRSRLEKSSKRLPSSWQIGIGRIDLFEAVFNGSFEIGDLSEWSRTGTCGSIRRLGPLTPRHRKRMGYCSTGPSSRRVSSTLQQNFTIQNYVNTTDGKIPVKFRYDFVTEEYNEWVGTQYDDTLTITITAPNGSSQQVSESVNGSSFSWVNGIDFPGGDKTVGHTGWKTASKTIAVNTKGGANFKIHITDKGDSIYDSVVLIDHIRLK